MKDSHLPYRQNSVIDPEIPHCAIEVRIGAPVAPSQVIAQSRYGDRLGQSALCCDKRAVQIDSPVARRADRPHRMNPHIVIHIHSCVQIIRLRTHEETDFKNVTGNIHYDVVRR